MSYTVEKNEYEVPCDHPLCEQLHQRFMETNEYVDDHGKYQKVRYHNKRRIEWVIVKDGQRADPPLDEAYDTKREAAAELRFWLDRWSDDTK